VTGTMNGATITRKIPFEVTDADGITKNPVPIVRNHCYLVQINPAPGQTDISYKLTVDEWNAVDTVNVQPNQDQVPVISNYACAAATNTFGTFDALTGMPDTIVVPATGGAISFTASCPFDTRVTVDYASSDDGNGWLEVTSRSEAVVTKAESSLARTYEITVKPNVGLDATLVNRGYLYIANGANGSVMDTVTIYQGENIAYGETRFAAIPMGQVSGKDVIWAPVNVGATEIATQIKKDADIITDEEKAANERQCGYYFQWGRKVPFRYGGEPGDLAPSGVTLSTYENATKSDYEYATKFIMNSAAWFSDYAVFGKNWPKENDPCPAGWRVPTKEELQIVFDQTPAIDGTTGIWTSAATPAFVLPAGGDRRFDSGLSESRGGSAIYWSATLDGGKAYRLNTDPLLDKRDIAPGYLVRCVKE
ncbi:hypothetical protein AALM74_21020, partial [Parabacteroides segnis]